MDSIHLDFLAYEGIEESVDVAYRSYLDASVLDIAVRHPDQRTFRNEVQAFRRRELYTPETNADVEGAGDPWRLSEVTPLQLYKYGFLYWFDLRVEYWSERKTNAAELAELSSADTLKWIFDEFSALKIRLAAADERTRNIRGRASSTVKRATGSSAPEDEAGERESSSQPALKQQLVDSVCASLRKRTKHEHRK